MMLIRLLPTLAAIAVLSACAPQRKPLPAPPLPAPAPAPVAAATPAPPPADWRDAAQTPGDWRYMRVESTVTHSDPPERKTTAVFARGRVEELFALSCERAARQVRLSIGGPPGEVPVTITTTSAVRTFSGSRGSDGWITVALLPRDPILDAMAFSRGRFMIEVPGMPALYLPAWPEVGRVIEDCR